MVYELGVRGLTVQREIPIPLMYKGIAFEEGFRADLIVNGIVLLGT